MKLKGKVAIITGGTRGIGLACSELFAKEGATVIACATSVPETPPAGIECRVLNVTDRADCQALYEDVVAKHGKIDILINNAGITRDAMTRKMTDEQWDTCIDVNLNGVFNLTRHVGTHMQANGVGAIINVSSLAGEIGNIGQANYSAAKAAVIGLTKTWAKEFALKGAQVRVNCITPGFIATDMVKSVPQEVVDKLTAGVPLGKMGRAEDIANAALFLACDDSAYITGQVIGVNGGMAM